MIYLFSGTPGSGKSLHMARTIYYWLRSGSPCICNFDIDINKIPHCKGQFIYLDNEYLTPDNLIKFSKVYFHDHKFKEGAIRLYVDECQLILNSRDWNSKSEDPRKSRSKWLSFFTQHRKFGYDIYLVAQFDRMLDRQIRSLVEYEVIHRKVSNYGIGGKILCALFLLRPVFVAVTVWYPMHEKTSSEFFTAHKKYYQIYDTFNTFDDFKNKNMLITIDNDV